MSPTKHTTPYNPIMHSFLRGVSSQRLESMDFRTTEQRVFANTMARQVAYDYNQSTKEENSMNNNELDLKGLLEDNTPEGMEVDMEKSTLQKIVFKKKVKSTRWEDLKGIEGYYTDSVADVRCYEYGNDAHAANANTYATMHQCKAHLAQAKLSQIMRDVNGDWEADWKDPYQNKYCIICNTDKYSIDHCNDYNSFLVFKSKERAERVLRENADLLEQYKPLAG